MPKNIVLNLEEEAQGKTDNKEKSESERSELNNFLE